MNFFDLIVSDIELPGMNGYELAQYVRANNLWKDIPMIALSSHAMPEDIDRGHQAGFTSYLSKIDSSELVQTINQTFANQYLSKGA